MALAYTTPISVTNQFYFCGLPLRLDTYRGCAFQCAFCFARRRGGNTPGPVVIPARPSQIRHTFQRAVAGAPGLVAQFLRRRVPIHFGGMSDPFQALELRHRISEQALRILKSYEYPTVISTRGTLIGESPYIDILRSMPAIVVQFSLSSSVDELARRSEPNSSPPSAVLRCLEKLSRNGVNVTCRWQPYIPTLSEAPHDFITRVASAGCKHVSFEHLKVPLERKNRGWSRFTNAIGTDLFELYDGLGAVRDGREYVLPTAAKRANVLAVALEAKTSGMTFGAADNEFQYLSDTACCCSGADRFPGFENFFKHQIGYALRKCRGKKISYSSIEKEWAPEGSIDRFLNSRSRISQRNGGSSVRDHIKKRWNQVEAPGSPSSFFGVAHQAVGSGGMSIYKWLDDI